MGLASRSEAELVVALLRGDKAAFGDFYDAYFPRLFQFVIRRVSGDQRAAALILRNSLCRAMRDLAAYRAGDPLFPWLCEYCRPEIVRYLRSSASRDERIRKDSETSASMAVALRVLASCRGGRIH